MSDFNFDYCYCSCPYECHNDEVPNCIDCSYFVQRFSPVEDVTNLNDL